MCPVMIMGHQLHGPPTRPPFSLHVLRSDGRELVLSLPGNSEEVRLRTDALDEGTLQYNIRAQSSEPTADTICNYVCRGDFNSAQALAGWVRAESEEYLLHKWKDPYAAAVGAYLLLRLKEFDRLRDWPRNLANGIPFLADGCVLWASQLAEEDPTQADQIRDYLLQGAQRGFPVNTAGLRLLIDGLTLLDHEGCEALQALRSRAGQVIWSLR